MIKENFNRKSLIEGRNYGFGFSFLNKIEEGNFETMNAFTACKDYLNDFVYIENTGKPLNQVYGFKHTYRGDVFNNDYFYLGVKPLNRNHSNDKDPHFDSIEHTLTTNNINLITLLNKLEDKLDFPKTEFEYLEGGTLVLKVSSCWGRTGFLISLYTLYIRLYANITSEELELSLEDIIVKEPNCIIKEDKFLANSTKHWIEDFYFNELLNYEYPKDPSSHSIHNYGISTRLAEIKYKAKAAPLVSA